MNKQKQSPYQDLILKKFQMPLRTENTSHLSYKHRQTTSSNLRINRKKASLSKKKIQNQDQKKKTVDNNCQKQQKDQMPLKIQMPKQILFNQQFNPLYENNSLRKAKIFEIDNRKLVSSQIKIKRNCLSVNNKNIGASSFFSKKDYRETRLKNFLNSPYLRNITDISKIQKMLQPVHGPNESIKKQIIQYNQNNKKNHEIVVLRRVNQPFQAKREVYLERIGLSMDSKVFIMNSRDYHIRQALVQRGWIELDDLSDSFFHLKWVYSDASTQYANLNRGQLFNHFHNNQELTNKNSLRKNINAASIQNKPSVPLTFDFGISHQFKRFVQSATLFEGLRILNMIKKCIQSSEPQLYAKIRSNSNYFKYFNKNFQLISLKKKDNNDLLNRIIRVEEKIEQISEIIDYVFELMNFLVRELERQKIVCYSFFGQQIQNKKTVPILKIFQYFENAIKSQNFTEFLQKIPKFLKVQLFKLSFHFQNSKIIYKSSYGIQNTWIVKPIGVSRGAGIYIESDYKKLLSHASNQHGKIIQKYIQGPFLISNQRKCDLRQWVLVKSFQPFQAYAFNKLYGRICPQKYVLQDFQNVQRHLTNYSLSKDYYRVKKDQIMIDQQIHQMQNCEGLKKLNSSSIVLEEDLQKEIKKAEHRKNWQQIKLQIYNNIIKTLKVCSGSIVQNQSCFEVYGFDILLDEDLNVFIIEVNLSPACEKREGLEAYLQKMSHGLVDYFELWLKLDDKKGENDFSNSWVRLDEQLIKEQLEEIIRRKLELQKVILIQNWVRSRLLKRQKIQKKIYVSNRTSRLVGNQNIEESLHEIIEYQ